MDTMNQFYRRLQEGLPERSPPARDAFQVDPKSLKRWIDALPLANASVAARMLFQAVRELNRMAIDPIVRLTALESLRLPIGQLADAIDRQIVGSSFPLPPQKAQLALAAREFQREMAVGYRFAVVELCGAEGKVPFLRGRAVGLAIERAISHLNAELCKGYFVYGAPAEGVWRTMNALYGYAMAVKLEDKMLDDPLLGGADCCPRWSYAHALLLAASNPYRLTQKEIHEAFQIARAWAPSTQLRAGSGGARAYAVPLEDDRGPGYLPEERTAGQGSLLSFETSLLEGELTRQLDLAGALGGNLSFRIKSGAAITVGADLVRRLMAAWQFHPDRAHSRLPAGHAMDTLVGLHAVHFHLAGGIDFETFVRRACGTAIHATERERLASWASSPNETGKPDVARARVLDQGLGGYRLLWEPTEQVRARVGELIAISLPPDPDDAAEDRDWMIGMIRWLRIQSGGGVDAGIELLARRARPAVLRALDGAGLPRPSVRAVVLARMGEREPAAPVVMVAPAVIERGAPRYELRAAPDRYAEVDGVEIVTIPQISVIEQSPTYVRIGATPGEAAA